MNCENIKEKLSLYIDDLLDADEAAEIKNHLKGCDSCKTYYEKLLKLGQIVDGFSLSENEEHWESQKNKVLDQINRAEADKILEVPKIRKQNNLYKYLAVAASLALVAFVSIYESNDFGKLQGMFDDTEISSPTMEQLPETDSVEDLTVRGGRVGETSFEAEVLSDKDEIVIDDFKEIDKDSAREKSREAISIQSRPAPSKKRDTKSNVTLESVEEDVSLKVVRTESERPRPVAQKPEVDLGEPIRDLGNGESNSIIRPTGLSNNVIEVEPLTINLTGPKVAIEKTELSPAEKQKKAIESSKDPTMDYRKSDFTFKSDESKDYMPERPMAPAPPVDTTVNIEETNIYKNKLDSLENKYRGIYSPHYRESSAKGRRSNTKSPGSISAESAPVSLDPVILEIAETCFQVGILSTDENEREVMIGKLRRLSIHGSPETIEKIQRYIVLLLTAE